MRGRAEAGRVRQLYGDSATFDFAPFAAQFGFVDAWHGHDYVMKDSESAVDLVQRAGGGLILWYDCAEWEGVTRTLNELYARDARFSRLRWIRGTTLAMLEVG